MKNFYKHFVRPVSLALILSILFVPGCGGGDGGSQDQKPVAVAEGAAFWGSLLSKALGGIVAGAEGKIGGEVMGVMLQLIGFSTGEKDYTEAIAGMNDKLDQITSKLGTIATSLKQLETTLEIDADKIIANLTDPSVYITIINAHQETFNSYVDPRLPPPSKDELITFATDTESQIILETAVTGIHDAILPPTAPVRNGALDNYVDLCKLKMEAASATLNQCYQGLELYLSQLLYYQIRGVNLVVEAKNVLDKAGKPRRPSAKDYISGPGGFIQSKLKPEVDNFILNVRRLVLSRVDLANSNSFLPADAQSILARADFLAIQIMNAQNPDDPNNHFGLSSILISTKNINGGVIPNLMARNRAGTIYSGVGVSSTVSGKMYDSWQGNHVSGVSDYYFIKYDFGVLPNGEYDIVDHDLRVLATTTVKSYTSDYVVAAAGAAKPIPYGHVVIHNRVGPKDAFENYASWGVGSWDLEYVDLLYPMVASRAFGLTDGLSTCTFPWQAAIPGSSCGRTHFHGKGELAATFYYDGSSASPPTIHLSAHAVGAASYESSKTPVSIYYRIGILDLTGTLNTEFATNQKENPFVTLLGGTVAIDDQIERHVPLSNLIAGHEYYLYFYCSVYGYDKNRKTWDGEKRASMSLKDIKENVYITF